MASRTLMENAQAEMRPTMDNVLKDVSDGRNSLTSPDADRTSGMFNMTSSDEDDVGSSRHLQRLLYVLSSVPERVAKFESGKYVAQRNGSISFIYMANKS